jgi:hypothetical protein
MRPSVRPAVNERLDPRRELGNGKPGVSNTFTGTLPAGLSRLTKLKALCVLQPTTLCTPAGSPCRLARGLWCLAGRSLYDVGLRGSFPDWFSALRALTFLCAPVLFHYGCIRPLGACSVQRRIQTNHGLFKPWRLLERPQPRVRIGATFGSLKVSDHRDIGKNAFRGAFPAFVTSLTNLKTLYAPTISPSLAQPASMPASRFMKVSPRELLQRDPSGRDDCADGPNRSVRKLPHPVALR